MASNAAKSKVKFGSPPPRRTHDYDWDSIAGQLRRKPEEWALIFEQDRHSLVTAIRLGNIKALQPRRGFEVRTANNVRATGPARVCDLWMRYVPANDEER